MLIAEVYLHQHHWPITLGAVQGLGFGLCLRHPAFCKSQVNQQRGPDSHRQDNRELVLPDSWAQYGHYAIATRQMLSQVGSACKAFAERVAGSCMPLLLSFRRRS